MHILLIPSWYHTPTNPIRGSFFREQGLALHSAGHRVGMLVPPSKLRTWHGLAEVRRYWRRANHDLDISDDNGLMTYRIPWWGPRPAVDFAARRRLALAVFDRYCREQGTPDVIHGHSILYGGYLAAHIKQVRGIPAIITEHSTAFTRRLIFPDQGRRAGWTVRHADCTLAVSPALAAALARYAPDCTVQPIFNSVDVDFFRPAAELPSARPFRFISIGSLIPRKGMDLLLHAFAHAFGGADVRLQIIGAGAEHAALDRLVAELELADQVELSGQLSRDGVRSAMQAGHVIVSASYVETFGFTLIEAMACGKPVIATRSGGPEYFITPETGLLVPTGDAGALASALQQIRETYAQYDPAAIRAYCLANFSNDALVRHLETVYESLLATTPDQSV
jgi:glycosyltransferase involved in cell wall biosynthesis